MIYGMYRSATGVMTATHRINTIANNLANAQTTGFKRDLAATMERRTAAEELGLPGASSAMLDRIGGGTLLMPTRFDSAAGGFQQSTNPLDLAIEGNGYFVVQHNGEQRLTRSGDFQMDNQGKLVTADGRAVLDADLKPIQLDPTKTPAVDGTGAIVQGSTVVARLAIKQVTDANTLKKEGLAMFIHPSLAGLPQLGSGTTQGRVMSGNLEMSNVDPVMELTQLMQTQRELEANANLIRPAYE